MLQGVYFYGDANDYFARLAYSAERLQAGQVALWNPYLSLGGTHAGDPAALTWYAPALFLFVLLPDAIAYNYTVILHLIIAAVGMYALARAWQQTRAAACLAALIYAFNGFAVAHLEHLNIVIGLAWLPVIIFFIDQFLTSPPDGASRPNPELTSTIVLRDAPSPAPLLQGEGSWSTRRVRYIVFSSLALGLQILGGHTQIVLYGGIVWGSLVLLRLVQDWRQGKRAQWLGGVLGCILMTVGGLGIAAIFLAPFVELLGFTARAGGVTYEYATSFSLEPARLVAFLYPYWFGGNPGSIERGPGSLIEMSAYIGIFALALTPFALARREGRVYLLGGLAFVGLLLALGKFTPVYSLLYHLPLFGSVRVPARLLLIVVFALALLAGFGLDQLRTHKLGSIQNFVLAALSLFCVLTLAFALIARLGIPLPNSIAQALTNPALLTGLLIGGASAVLMFVWMRGMLSERVRVGLTLLLVFLDLLSFGWNFRYNFVAPSIVYAEPSPTAEELMRDPNALVYYWARDETKQATYLQQGRLDDYVSISRGGLRQSLPMRFHVRAMQGYGSESPNFADIVNAIDASRAPDDRALGMMGGFGANRLLTQSDVSTDALSLLAQSGGVKLYENRRAQPRALFVTNAQSVPDAAAALAALQEPLFDEEQVVVEGPPAASATPITADVQFLRNEPEAVSLTVQTNGEGYLILNDTFYPGWRAQVDGQPATIYRANALVRAVRVAAGSHTVEFIYDPLSVKLGALISASTLLVLALALAWDLKNVRNKYRSPLV